MTTELSRLDYQVITLLEKLETVRRDAPPPRLMPANAEMRTLEFWRSIISECLASFFYVFTVCGAAAAVTSGATSGQTILAAALASGFTIAALTQSFGHISGCHVNPAVSAAMAITRNISLLRGLMFVVAQCGGSIAGAALLYGVTVPGRQGSLSVTVLQLPPHLTPWERFGLELILTFVVVFTYFVAMDSQRRWTGTAGLTVGAAYLAASLVSMPFLNPARALGPAFVMNKWDNHWVFWFAPILGGVLAGFIYEFIFNPRRHTRRSKESIDGDSSSIHSDEDTYDELEKPRSTYNTLRAVPPGSDLYRAAGGLTPASPSGGGNPYCPSLASASLYSAAPPCKLDRVESLYGGTKSLYAKSPPLTRANLNRSQSVYTKSSGCPPMANRDGPLPHPGPLVPAQSLYPMRLNSVNSSSSANTNAANQNTQNQQRLGGESVYGVRPVNNGGGGIYGKIPGRTESIYGTRRQNSEDSAYGSSHHSTNGNQMNMQQQQQQQQQTRSNYGHVGGKSFPSGSNYGHLQGNRQQHHSPQQPPPPPQHQQQQQQQHQPQQQQQQQSQQQQQQQNVGIPSPPPPYIHHTQRNSPNLPY
ncbi:neurogenic protein big brain [Nilaparvata lugens]|uniref:neurogenic protein big brain n=1 Tax=Nilaparvata lugens TaxID=108931 RepID=UPI00193D2A20|nr:neurogenic protein big brain [Nilaparvata lugens]